MAKKLTLDETRYKLAKAHWDSVQLAKDRCECDKCAMITDADKAKRILTNVPKGYPKAKPVVKVRSVKHHDHDDHEWTFGKLPEALKERIRNFNINLNGVQHAMHEGYADDLPVRIECQHYANNGTFFEVMRTKNGKPAKNMDDGYDGITVKIAELHEERWQ